MAERPIDELKIKVSVDESGNVAKSLNQIIAKLDKINEAGKGANAFADLLTTLSNMDKSLSKISHSLTRVANGIRTISATSEAWGGKFSNSLNNIDKGMSGISEAAKESSKGLSEIVGEAKTVEKTFSNFNIETYFDDSSIKNVTESLNDANVKMAEVTENANDFKTVFEDTRNVEGPFKQYDTEAILKHMENYSTTLGKVVSQQERISAIDLSRQYSQVDLLKEKYNELADKLAMMLREENFGGKKFANIIAEMQKIDSQIAKIENEAQRVNDVVEQTPPALSRVAYAIENIGTGLVGVARGTWRVFNSVKGIAANIFKIQAFPIYRLGKEIGSIHKRLQGVIKSFMRVAKMRAFRYTIRAITAGIREGIDNAYQWAKIMGNQFAGSMDSLATSSLYLKNSLGALATPIINALAPAFDYLIDKVVSFLNLINQLISSLSGKTWTRAIKYAKDYSDAVGGAAGNAGKLADALVTILGIDEINPLNAAKDSGGSGGGGAGNELDYSSMFTTEPIETMSEALSNIFEPFKKAWETKGQSVIDSITRTFTNIKLLVSDIGKSLETVWTNGTGQFQIETILQTFTNISDTIGNIADRLRTAWNTDDLGTDIIQNLADALSGVLDMWERISKATADWAKSIDFTGVMRGIRNLTQSFKDLLAPIEDGLVWAWRNVLLPLAGWVIQDVAPKALDAISAGFDAIREVIEKVEPFLKWLYEKLLAPGLTLLGKVFVGALEGVAASFTAIAEALDKMEMPEWLKWLWEKGFKPTELSWGTSLVESDFGSTLGKLLGGFVVPIRAEVTQLDDKVPTQEKKFGGIIGLAEALFKGTGFKNNVDTFGTYASSLNQGNGYINNIATFLAYATRLNKGTGFNNNIDSFIAYATKLNAGTGYTNSIASFIAYATALNQAKGYTNNVDSFVAYATKLEKGKGYQNLIQTFIAYATALKKASNFSGFTITGSVTAERVGSQQRVAVALKKEGGIFSNGFWKSIPQYAKGTINAGSLFVAGEAGAEVVGNINGRTEVLNQSQIAQAMANSMLQANAHQNAILQEQNNLLRQLLAKDTNVTAILSTSSLVDGANRQNKRAGKTIIPIGV